MAECSFHLGISLVNEQITTREFSGSVEADGRQTFRLEDSGAISLRYGNPYIYITGSGTGFVEIGTTASMAEDDGYVYRFVLLDSVFRSTNGGSTYQQQASAHIPRIGLVGHSQYLLKLETANITSSPYNGEAYAVGEPIEVSIRLNSAVQVSDDALSVPLLFGTNPGQQRALMFDQVYPDKAHWGPIPRKE